MARSCLAAALAATVLAVVLASSTGAASPVPSPTPSAEPSLGFDIEAWLDAPVPADAAPGTMLRIGAVIWLPGNRELVRQASFKVLLHPASGSAQPAFDYGSEDFSGHIVADVLVPEGGAGELEILLPSTVCENDVCGPRDTPVPIRGVGPPPNVPLPALATAVIDPPIQAIVVGAPATFGLSVQPRIRWPEPGLRLPVSVWLQVREPQGPILDDVAAALLNADIGRYEATVTFDREGELVIQAAAEAGAEADDLFGASVRRVIVEPGSTAAPAPGASSGNGGQPGWVLGALVGLVGLGLAIALLDRGRARKT